MTSIYGDLILQDGANVIDKSGNRFGSPIQRFFNVAISVSTSLTPGFTANVPCLATIYGKKVVIDISSFLYSDSSAYGAGIFIGINGIPSDLVSTKPIMGTGLLGNTDNNNIGLCSSALAWTTGLYQIKTNDFILFSLAQTFKISQFSLVYDL
ncbi:hypothetical protein ACTFIY_004575 [Dictyostelium cf. discoideum]